MVMAAIMMFGIPPLLLIVGGVMVWQAIVRLRRSAAVRSAGILRLIAGAGVLACALIWPLGMLAQMQYAVVVLPLLGIVLAVFWGFAFMTPALIVEYLADRRDERASTHGPR
jgi:hypothetical protein